MINTLLEITNSIFNTNNYFVNNQDKSKHSDLTSLIVATITPEKLEHDTFKKRKIVQFYNIASVVLIPTRTECVEAGLADALWWNKKDYTEFKTDAVSEIKEYATAKNIHVLKAITELYQP